MRSECDILVVEDSLTQALKLQHILKGHGCLVTLARSGREALAALDKHAPALILSEIVMPDMDGYQLCRQVKAQESHRNIPVILLASFTDPQGIAKALDCGADDWIAKPYDEQSLLARLDDILDGREERGPASSALMALLHSTYDAAVQRTSELRQIKKTLEDLEEEWEKFRAASQETSQETVLPQTLVAPSEPPSAAPLAGLHILLAEDSVVNQRVALRALEKSGHSVVIAENGKQALAALEREPFDLALMDIEMPEMGGYEATALIRRREKATGAHLPIIAMTAHNEPEALERCLSAGMDGYTTKPLRAEELYAVMEQVTAAAPPIAPPPIASPETVPTEDEQPAEVALDREDALARVDGDKELLQEIIGLFQEEIPAWTSQIREAVAQGDGEKLERAAHSLKGAAANISAVAVVAAALRLETLGREKQLEDAEEAHRALENALQALQPVLAQLLAE